MAKVIINHGEASTVLTVSEPNLQFVHSAISFHDRRDRRIDDISYNFLALQHNFEVGIEYLHYMQDLVGLFEKLMPGQIVGTTMHRQDNIVIYCTIDCNDDEKDIVYTLSMQPTIDGIPVDNDLAWLHFNVNASSLQQCYLDAYDYLNAAKERTVAIVELLDRVFQQVYDDDMFTNQTIEIQE